MGDKVLDPHSFFNQVYGKAKEKVENLIKLIQNGRLQAVTIIAKDMK